MPSIENKDIDAIELLVSIAESVMAHHSKRMGAEDVRSREAAIAEAKRVVERVRESATSKNNVAVVVEGGVVQSILYEGAQPDNVVVIDYDTDGVDNANLVDIPQGNGKVEQAVVNEYSLEPAMTDSFSIQSLLDEKSNRKKPSPSPM